MLSLIRKIVRPGSGPGISSRRIRKSLHPALAVLTDAAAVAFALYLAFWIRVRLNPLFLSSFDWRDMPIVFPRLQVVIPVWIAVFCALRFYSPCLLTYRRTLSLSIRGSTLSIICLIATSFFTRDEFSRSLILILWLVSVPAIGLANHVCTGLLLRAGNKTASMDRIAIVGIGDEVKAIGETIKASTSMRESFCGYIVDGKRDESISGETIGSIHDLETAVRRCGISRILAYRSSLSHQELLHLSLVCEKNGIAFYLIPDLFDVLPVRINVSRLGNIPFIEVRKVWLGCWAQLVKRAVDIVTVLVGGIFLAPFLAALALLIKLDSPGPVIYRQERVGKNGRTFCFYKFRSMRADADALRETVGEKHGVDRKLYKIRRDPRITRIGKIIRKASIDELPQLFNVLKGDMTLVGPRPLPVSDIREAESDPACRYWFTQRTHVLPGITGLWQIHGRSDLTFQEMVKYDIYYILNWSLALDLEILFKTVPVILLGRGAY